ncbi:MAG: NAD(P)-dependent oxidoreductase [Rhodocyclaceae bacterium]|nr:NAD(P)-dependent oxidoreductase [Rhodocyclaceae bacterium]
MKSDKREKPCVLVTGGSGYIGSKLVARLVTSGWVVHLIVRPEANLIALEPFCKAVAVHYYDGSMESVAAAVSNSRPDIVFHLASLFLAQHKTSDVDDLIASNVQFGAQLLEAMDRAGVRNLINTGTSWQVFEGCDYNPVNLYAATKQAFEDIARYYSEARGLRMITLRLFDTYGVDDPRPKLIPLLRRAAKSGEALEMSPGEQKIDLVHVDDVVECFIVAARRLRDGLVKSSEVYGVTTGKPLRLRDIVKIFSEQMGTPLNIRWGARPYREREVMQPWSGGHCLPGWQAKIDLVSGISEIIRGSPKSDVQQLIR